MDYLADLEAQPKANTKPFKRKEAFAYCSSSSCMRDAQVKKRKTYTGKGVLKKVPFGEFFCHDCAQALYWETKK